MRSCDWSRELMELHIFAFNLPIIFALCNALWVIKYLPQATKGVIYFCRPSFFFPSHFLLFKLFFPDCFSFVLLVKRECVIRIITPCSNFFATFWTRLTLTVFSLFYMFFSMSLLPARFLWAVVFYLYNFSLPPVIGQNFIYFIHTPGLSLPPKSLTSPNPATRLSRQILVPTSIVYGSIIGNSHEFIWWGCSSSEGERTVS